jgi:hypothetical protein
VNVVDENFPEGQQAILRRWRVRFRQIGKDIGKKGRQDEEVIPLLHKLARPTFFTLDEDFYDRWLCHAGYCLVYLDVHRNLAAEYVRRFLRHQAFDDKAKRMGRVVRVHPTGVAFWQVRQNQQRHLLW